MTFAEAMQALQDGKKVRRKSWPSFGGYWTHLVEPYRVYLNDIEATDWEIVDEPRPKCKVTMRFYLFKDKYRDDGVWAIDGQPRKDYYIPTDWVQEITYEEPEA